MVYHPPSRWGGSMSQRSGIGGQAELERTNSEGPQLAYLMLVSGTYRFGAGKKELEATAYLKDHSGVFKLDDSAAEEDREPVLSSPTNGTVLV